MLNNNIFLILKLLKFVNCGMRIASVFHILFIVGYVARNATFVIMTLGIFIFFPLQETELDPRLA